MSEPLTKTQWDTISAELQAPFDPDDVDFRPQSISKDKTKGQAVCYVESRVIMDRLDEVVGAGNWSFEWVPLVIDKGEVLIGKGTLTIYGVSKSDVGEASTFAKSKGCVADMLKRSAVLWGISRYLYNVPSPWVKINEWQQIPPEIIADLRKKLPKPGQPPQPARLPAAPVPPQLPAATRPMARAEAAPPSPTRAQPEPPTTNVTAMDAARASELAQRDIANKLRDAGYNTLEKVEGFLEEHLGVERVGDDIDPMRLKDGVSEITVGEVRTLIAALSTANQRRAAGNLVPEGAL